MSADANNQCLRFSLSGDCGSKRQIARPTAIAMLPSMINNHLQEVLPVVSAVSDIPTPYAMRPLNAPDMVAAKYTKAMAFTLESLF